MNLNPVDVFLLDPLGIISRGDKYTIDRHRNYQLKFTEKFPGSTFRVLSIGVNNYSKLNDNYWLFYVRDKSRIGISFFIKSRSIINKSQNPEKVLISGDPWISGLFAILLKNFGLSRDVKVQIQCHADFLNPVWSHGSLRRKFKVYLGSQVIRRADSIRVVSNSQMQYFPPDLLSRIFVSPVSLNLVESKNHSVIEKRPLTIGLVGRMDKDRGIDKFFIWVTELNKVNNEFKVVLIGAGPLLNELRESLIRILGETRISSYGHLSPQELANTWEKIGMLFSTAPTESFGRTIREAIWHGVPVLALTSSGVQELAKFVDHRYLKVVNYDPDGSELAALLENSRKMYRNFAIAKAIEDKNLESFNILINSWNIHEK